MTDVPVVPLDEDGVASLTELKASPQFGWYLRRRVRALARLGLLAAGDWNPFEHPRGPDGEFIRKWGWVRWLKDGNWQRGQVLFIDSTNGDIKVAHDGNLNHVTTYSHSAAEKQLYALPKPKAKLGLPDPATDKDAKGWKKIGGQGGSNPGGLYQVVSDEGASPVDAQAGAEAPKPDAKYYIKTAKSPDHARQEALANDLYELGGVAVPEVTTSFDDTQIASKIVQESQTKDTHIDPNGDPAVLSKVRENLVFDAWLANWDVVGAVYDNMQVIDGTPVRIDTGGSLMYRAKGDPKGNMFGPNVGELDSLRNADLNPEGAAVFGATTPDELKAGGERLRAITPADIRQAVEDRDLPDTLADILIARRSSVLAQIGMTDTGPKVADLPKPKVTIDEPAPADVYKALDNVNQVDNPYGDEKINGVFDSIGEAGLDEVSNKEIHWDSETKTWAAGPGHPFSAAHDEYDATLAELTDQGDMTLDSLAGNTKYPTMSPAYIVRTSGGMYSVQLTKNTDGTYQGRWSDLAYPNKQFMAKTQYDLPGDKTLHVYSVNETLTADTVHIVPNAATAKRADWEAKYQTVYAETLGSAVPEHIKSLEPIVITDSDPLKDDEFPGDLFFVRAHPWTGDRTDLLTRNGVNRGYGWILDKEGKPWIVIGSKPNEHGEGVDFTVADMDGHGENWLAQKKDDTLIGLVPSSAVLDDVLDARRQMHDGTSLFDEVTDTPPDQPLDTHTGVKVQVPEIEKMEAEAAGPDMSKWLVHYIATTGMSGGPIEMGMDKKDVKAQASILVNAGFGQDDIKAYISEQGLTDIDAETWIWKENASDGWKGVALPGPGDTVWMDGMIPYKVQTVDPKGKPAFTIGNEQVGETIEVPDAKTLMVMFTPKEKKISDAADWDGYPGGLPEVEEPVIYNGEQFNVSDVIGGTVVISDGIVSKEFSDPAEYHAQVSKPPEPENIDVPESEFITDVPPGAKFNIIGDPERVSNYTTPAHLQKFVGKNVYLKRMKGNQHNPSGFFTVTEVIAQTYDPKKLRQINLKTAQGKDVTWIPSLSSEASIAETEYAPPHLKNFTMKQDGTINVNGYVVGHWKKDSSSWEAFQGTIDPEFSPTGKEITVQSKQKGPIKEMLLPQVLIPGAFDTHDAKPKTPAAIAAKQKTLSVTYSADGPTLADNAQDVKTLGDGSDAKVGMWVMSSRDGSVGQISEIVGIHHFKEGGFEKAYGFVKIEYPNGKTGVRSSKTLYASPDPNTGALPPLAPKWSQVKLSDDTTPFPAQAILLADGSPATVLDIKMQKGVGLIKHRDPATGKNVWTKAATMQVDPSSPFGQPVDDLSPAGIIAALEAEGIKHPNKLAQAGDIAFPSPDGKVISQPASTYTTWFEGNPDRKLTKDGFVPTIGMWVRDKDGKSYRVLKVNPPWATNPNAVTVWDPDPTVSGFSDQKKKTKTVSALWVDHEAETASVLPTPLTNIKIVKTGPYSNSVSPMPSKAVALYGVKTWEGLSYVVTTSDGEVYTLNGYGNWTYDKNAPPTLEKIANINPDDSNEAELVLSGDVYYNTKWDVVVGKKGEHDETVAEKANDEINTPKADPAPTATPHEPEPATPDPNEPMGDAGPTPVTVGIPPKYEGILTVLPKPADIMDPPKPEPAGLDAYPKPPDPVGDGTRLGGTSSVMGGHTVEEAYTGVLDRWRKNEYSPGSGVQYAMTDSDKIEDMTVRSQIVEDIDGTNYVEVRFGLLEGAVDDLSDRLLTVDKKAPQQPVGGWVASDKVYVTDLVPGDRMAAKISGFEQLAGTLKPIESAEAPNVTVTDFPLLIGKAANGYDVYSIPIVNHHGEPGIIYAQKRENPSMQKFDWDPNLMPPAVSTTDGTPAKLSPRAEQLGWKILTDNALGTPKMHDSDWHGLEVDPTTGVKKVDISNPNVHKIDTRDPKSKRLVMALPSGSNVNVQVTHTSSSRNKSLGGGHNGRRATQNGEVLIRVPVDNPDPMGEVSRLMAAVGVEPENQDQPNHDEIMALALNKVYKQISPSYTHMATPAQGDEAGVLKLIDNLVGPELGRPATIDDIRLRLNPQGAPTIVFSDEVALAMAKKSGVSTIYSRFEEDSSIPDKLKTIVASRLSQGLLSGDERWSAGIFMNGTYGPSSPRQDAQNDAGNRIYFSTTSSPSLGLSAGTIYSPAAVLYKQTDWYWTSNDAYGERPGNNARAYMPGVSPGGQTMVKRMFEGDQWGRVVVEHGTKQSIIDALKKEGVTELGGRPIEEVVVEPSSGSANDFGVPLVPPGSTEIPISQAGVGPPSPVLPGLVTVP